MPTIPLPLLFVQYRGEVRPEAAEESGNAERRAPGAEAAAMVAMYG